MTPFSSRRPFNPTEIIQYVIPTEKAERPFKLSSRPRERSERVEGSIRLAKLAQDKPIGNSRRVGGRIQHPVSSISSIGHGNGDGDGHGNERVGYALSS